MTTKQKIFRLEEHHLVMLNVIASKYGSEVQAVRAGIEKLYRDYWEEKVQEIKYRAAIKAAMDAEEQTEEGEKCTKSKNI